MKALSAIAATLIAAAGTLAAGYCSFETSAQAQPAAKPARPLPMFEVDPNWPKMPANFRPPFVSGIQIDSTGNAWLTTRPARAQADAQKIVGPPIMIFDPNGNYIRGWGGPGAGYELSACTGGAHVCCGRHTCHAATLV